LYHIKFFNAFGELMQSIEIHTMEPLQNLQKLQAQILQKAPLYTIESIFTIKVPLFGHMTQRLCFCYLPNIKSLWNKFKWKILDNSNYDNLHGGGNSSHAYVIMYKYFDKT